MPINLRFSDFAATQVVPLPQNGSRTMSPSFVTSSIIRWISFTGFCVGYPHLSFALGFKKGISHTSDKGTPFFSDVRMTFPLASFLYSDLPFEFLTR